MSDPNTLRAFADSTQGLNFNQRDTLYACADQWDATVAALRELVAVLQALRPYMWKGPSWLPQLEAAEKLLGIPHSFLIPGSRVGK